MLKGITLEKTDPILVANKSLKNTKAHKLDPEDAGLGDLNKDDNPGKVPHDVVDAIGQLNLNKDDKDDKGKNDNPDKDNKDDKDDKLNKDDLWVFLARLEWKDTSEGKNASQPSAIWKQKQYQLVKKSVPPLALALEKSLEPLVAAHPEYTPEKKRMLAYHIVAKGQSVYTAVLRTPDIAVAFMGEEEDFEGFLREY